MTLNRNIITSFKLQYKVENESFTVKCNSFIYKNVGILCGWYSIMAWLIFIRTWLLYILFLKMPNKSQGGKCPYSDPKSASKSKTTTNILKQHHNPNTCRVILLLKYIFPRICTRISLDYAFGMTDPRSKQIPMLFVKFRVDWEQKKEIICFTILCGAALIHPVHTCWRGVVASGKLWLKDFLC